MSNSVRVCVHLDNSEDLAKLVHATPYEPCYVNREEGILGYVMPYHRVEAILTEFANTNTCRFTAHMIRNTNNQ